MFYIRLCRNHLCWTFAAMILWKTQLWDTFARLHTAEWIVSSNHDVSWEDDYCVMFFKLKFFLPTLRHMFCSPNPSNIYGERYLVSWKNINFCGLKKRLLFLISSEILLKDLLSSSLVDIIFLCTFLL